MLDFQNPKYIKLSRTDDSKFAQYIVPMFVEGEQIISTYVNIRDGVVFTNKRIIAINIQGLTGKKKDITILPYSKIQLYSIGTSGLIDIDTELELFFTGVGKVVFEFTNNSNIVEICQIISTFALR